MGRRVAAVDLAHTAGAHERDPVRLFLHIPFRNVVFAGPGRTLARTFGGTSREAPMYEVGKAEIDAVSRATPVDAQKFDLKQDA